MTNKDQLHLLIKRRIRGLRATTIKVLHDTSFEILQNALEGKL